MSIASEITRLQTSKADVKTQVNIDKDIINGGTAFIASETVDDYDDKIKAMQDAYKKFIPIQTETGTTSVTIDNTIGDKVMTDIALYGNTEQFTTTGKNLFDGIMELGGIASATGQNEDLAGRIRSKNMVAISGSTFTISCVGSNKQTYIYCYDTNSSFLGVVGNAWSNFPYTFTVLTNTAYIRFIVRNSNNSNISPTDITNVQVEQGSSATTYEPYTGRNSFT